jgi:C1A family cysteine protease
MFMLGKHIMLPASVDLRSSCPPVYDQGDLGACTGNAIAGIIEIDRIHQKLDDWAPSRLFIYYGEREVEGTISQDSGAQIRDGIKVVAKNGAPKESTWPYDIVKFATKPSDAAYAEGKEHEALIYSRVAQSQASIKTALAAGYPIVFGFTVYESFESDEVAKTGVAPMPHKHEPSLGGHAVAMVGYTPDVVIVRNSWGPDWGQGGYFTMPWAYVTNPHLADDFWVIKLVS